MKIVNITKSASCYVESINQLLNSNRTNDIIFDRYNILVTIKCEEDITDMQLSLIYRKLWESAYLRRNYNDQSSLRLTDDNTYVILALSLSEVITYIRQAVPPALQHLIKDSLTSINAIIDVMKQLLMDDNSGQQITYVSIFRKCIRFEPFETVMNDISLNKQLSDVIGEKWNCYVYMSDIPVADMKFIFNNKHVTTQILFKLNNADELNKFVHTYYHEISQYSHESYIANAYCDINSKSAFPVYVMVYLDHIHLVNRSIPFSMWIRESYKKFI